MSEITTWGLIVSIIALLASIIFIIISYCHNKLMLFNDLVREFLQVQRELKEHKKDKTEKECWDAQLFNTIEHASYLANRNWLLRKHTIAFLGEAFILSKENILHLHHDEDYHNKEKYEEWKKLSLKINKKK
jgi:hypothetical protein